MTEPAWVIPTREEILDSLRTADAPLTPQELALRLAVPPAHQEGLFRRVAAMERDGQLMPNRKGVLLLASKLDLVAGGLGILVNVKGAPTLTWYRWRQTSAAMAALMAACKCP